MQRPRNTTRTPFPPPNDSTLPESKSNAHHLPGSGFPNSPQWNRLPPPVIGSRFQTPPPSDRFLPPFNGGAFVPPPSGSTFQQPTSGNFLPQMPPKNFLQRPPPNVMLQKPPPNVMLRGPPTFAESRGHSSNKIFQYPPPSISQPPPNFKSQPPPNLTPPRYRQAPPQVITSGSPGIFSPENISSFANVQLPPPSLAGAYGPRFPPLPQNNSSDDGHATPPNSSCGTDDNASIQSCSGFEPKISSGISWTSDGKSLPRSELLSKGSTYEENPNRCSSVKLLGHSAGATKKTNTISKMPALLSSPISLSVPPPWIAGNSMSTNSCTAFSLMRMPPSNGSLQATFLSQRQSGNEAKNMSSAHLIEIPRHPLNMNYISSTKLQSIVDDWLSNKINSKKNAKEISNSSDNVLGAHSPRESSLNDDNSGTTEQASRDLKKILEESGIQKSKSDLLSSTLPLLSKPYRNFRLRDVHEFVATYKMLLDALKGSSDDTQRSALKRLLDPMKSILSDEKFQDAVKKLVGARTKKRLRKKRLKTFLKKEWDRQSRLIDAKREEVQRLEQQELQEAKLKSEVDSVMKEVRGKQEEATSLLTLLWAMRDLRQHRLNRGEMQGFVSSQQQDDMFNTVTDGLEKMVETQLSDYALEERTLQAMLQSTHAPHLNIEPCAAQSHTRDLTDLTSEVEEMLFGASSPSDPALYASYCSTDTSLEMLVARRRAWDEHLVGTKNLSPTTTSSSAAPREGGSGVPLCWVLPPARPALAWRQYQQS